MPHNLMKRSTSHSRSVTESKSFYRTFYLFSRNHNLTSFKILLRCTTGSRVGENKLASIRFVPFLHWTGEPNLDIKCCLSLWYFRQMCQVDNPCEWNQCMKRSLQDKCTPTYQN